MEEINQQVVCFGEVLWDILPDSKLPGGAPMNVGYHLHQHNVNTGIITSIGDDEDGRELKRWFRERGINTEYFQVTSNHSTGKVYAFPDKNGNMQYEIVKPVAWDFIAVNQENEVLVNQAEYFVYGSLASRSSQSRQTLLKLLEYPVIKIMDVNLRPPHYDRELLMVLMLKADILKLNEDELSLISIWMNMGNDVKNNIKKIGEQLNIGTIIITRGANGALVFTAGRFYEHPGYKVVVADTIGSGDAFLAGFIVKIIEGFGVDQSLDYAARLGAFVASRKGGCPDYAIPEVMIKVQTRD